MDRVKIKLLILPKFDIEELGNGVCGEGELFFNEYVKGGDEYSVKGICKGEKLYVKDGIALTLTHAGKVNAASAVVAILSDPRFDCSEMNTLSVGCAGTNYEKTVMGDVVIASGYADYDLGHQVIDSKGELRWFPDSSLSEYAVVRPNSKRISRIYDRVKDTALETTKKTQEFMRSFNLDSCLNPKVLKGTFLTSDNYWKGEDGHRVAKQINRFYGFEGEYMVSDMEEIAVARVLQMFGLDDRLISIRVSVNLDCFMNGATPEKLWSDNCFEDNVLEEENSEGADIFETAMWNLFKVGRRIIQEVMR